MDNVSCSSPARRPATSFPGLVFFPSTSFPDGSQNRDPGNEMELQVQGLSTNYQVPIMS